MRPCTPAQAGRTGDAAGSARVRTLHGSAAESDDDVVDAEVVEDDEDAK